MDATGARGRTDGGWGGDVAVYEAGGKGEEPGPTAAEMATGSLWRTPPLRRWLRGGAGGGSRREQGRRTTAVVPAWTRRHGTAARDVAVDVAARRTAADEATGRSRWTSPP